MGLRHGAHCLGCGWLLMAVLFAVGAMNLAWIAALAIHPYSMGGAYVNFMMDEGADRVKATYRDNYQRLVEMKRNS